MDTKAKFIGFLIGSALVLSVPFAYADNTNNGNVAEKQGEHQSMGGEHQGKLFKDLNLSDDQKKALKGVLDQQKETMKANFKQIRTNREAFDQEIAQPTPDMNKINDLQGQLKVIQGQMVDSHLTSTLEVKKVLTPEQFTKFLEHQKHMFSERFHRGDKEGHKSVE